MKKYILEGEDVHVQNIIQENSLRSAHGWVKFTEVEDEQETEEKRVETRGRKKQNVESEND
mgnify:FL=1|jgi:hypothetical protein